MRISLIRSLLHFVVALGICSLLVGWVDGPSELSSEEEIEAVVETSSLHSDEWGLWCVETVDGLEADACPREGALGGCYLQNPSSSEHSGTIYWEYAGPGDYSAADIMQNCETSGGKFLVP